MNSQANPKKVLYRPDKRTTMDHPHTAQASIQLPCYLETRQLATEIDELTIKHDFEVLEEGVSYYSSLPTVDHLENLMRLKNKEGQHFLHGNLVKLPFGSFYLSQYPKETSTSLFLQFLAQEHISIVFDLTEKGEIFKKRYSHLTEQEAMNKFYYSAGRHGNMFVVEEKNQMHFGALHLQQLKLVSMEEKTKEHIFYHAHFLEWKDHQFLEHKIFNHVLDFADLLIEERSSQFTPLIHCDGGVGRSGTFAAALTMRRYFKEHPDATFEEAIKMLKEVIWKIRVQRGPKCVETFMQMHSLVLYVYKNTSAN